MNSSWIENDLVGVMVRMFFSKTLAAELHLEHLWFELDEVKEVLCILAAFKEQNDEYKGQLSLKSERRNQSKNIDEN